MNPLITVITGTINRLPLLQRMVASARKEARFLPIHFIIVDSDSTDGTAEWCKSQADITHIPFGKPSGAIRAFTHGGMLADTRYTILANDDITFEPYSILSAYRALEDNPTVGAIAFADNRQNPNVYATQRHGARNAHGQPVGSVYAQVGMYRTPLMQGAGVWGADDPLFGGAGAWTYGGDNYLSSKIWEFGYLIATTPLAKITDYVHADETRKIGYSHGAKDAKLYHSRFDPTGNGRGAIFGSNRHNAPPCDTTPARRILQLPDIEPAPTPQDVQMTGLTNALNQDSDVLRYPYTLQAMRNGKMKMQGELYDIARVFKPDIILMQCQSTQLIDAHIVRSLRAELPNTVVVNWNGDYWREKLFDPAMVEMLRECHAQLVVDYAVIDRYADLGITARYWQVAPETPNITSALETVPYYDVLFMGAGYSPARRELITYLHGLKSKGLKVGLYGVNYPKGITPNGQTYYDFETSQALMSKAGVVIGAMEFQDTDGYVSNRFFEALQAGAVLLQQRIKNGYERLGIIDALHCQYWDEIADLDRLIPFLLERKEFARALRMCGKHFVRTEHTQEIRATQLLKIVEELQV